MTAWAIDNDVLSKGACYGFLESLIEVVGSHATGGVLGQAKFVLPKKIRRKEPAAGADVAIQKLQLSLSRLSEIEPTEPEIALAAELEYAAAERNVEFDSGESTLVAVMLTRGLERFYSGDKRAIRAMQSLIEDDIAGTAALANKSLCLEQGVRRMAQQGLASMKEIRRAVCENKQVDIALSICFSCASPELLAGEEGLVAYIEHLRREAPNVLGVD